MIRDHAVRVATLRLADLCRFDDRIEAHLDGLRVAQCEKWSTPENMLTEDGAGGFFVAALLCLNQDGTEGLEALIDQATTVDEAAGHVSREYDPWRGLLSALAWTGADTAVSAVEWLVRRPAARLRWLGIAAASTRRLQRHPALESALADPEPAVRARATRGAGEAGRRDLRNHLADLVSDADEDCRFWAAWSAVRLGTTGDPRLLAEFIHPSCPHYERALDLLLRALPFGDACRYLRQLAAEPSHHKAAILAAGAAGDAQSIPWLVERTTDPRLARAAGSAVAMITGVDLERNDLRSRAPAATGPGDDPDKDGVALDEDDALAWPDPIKLARWWDAVRHQFDVPAPYFLGSPKSSADWTALLQNGSHRRAAALELALRRPSQAMLEVRGAGFRQRAMLARAARLR